MELTNYPMITKTKMTDAQEARRKAMMDIIEEHYAYLYRMIVLNVLQPSRSKDKDGTD